MIRNIDEIPSNKLAVLSDDNKRLDFVERVSSIKKMVPRLQQLNAGALVYPIIFIGLGLGVRYTQGEETSYVLQFQDCVGP